MFKHLFYTSKFSISLFLACLFPLFVFFILVYGKQIQPSSIYFNQINPIFENFLALLFFLCSGLYMQFLLNKYIFFENKQVAYFWSFCLVFLLMPFGIPSLGLAFATFVCSMAIHDLMRLSQESIEGKNYLFNLGFKLGILPFCFSSAVFMPIIVIFWLIIFDEFRLKNLGKIILGWITPAYFIVSIAFLFDYWPQLLAFLNQNKLIFNFQFPFITASQSLLLLSLSTLLLFGIFAPSNRAGRNKVVAGKLENAFILTGIFSLSISIIDLFNAFKNLWFFIPFGAFWISKLSATINKAWLLDVFVLSIAFIAFIGKFKLFF